MREFEKIVPKTETLGLDLPSQNISSSHIGDNVASSSGSSLRSSIIGMGFSPSLVDKAIEEKGEDDVDLLLETLFAYSAVQNSQSESSDSINGLVSGKKDEIAAYCCPKEILHISCSESSDSLDSLFGDEKDTSSSLNIAKHICPKEEPDVHDAVNDDKRASLVMMNFSLDEVNFAMDKLGEDAPISELVDFIFAAQIAENQAQDKGDLNHVPVERNKDSNTESLFGTMDKTLRLLEMGFSENQISAAIEKYGLEVPIFELADSICVEEVAGTCSERNKHSSSWNCSNMKNSFNPFIVKTEDFSTGAGSQSRDIVDLHKYKGKRPKEEYIEELSSLKRPKQEVDDGLSSSIGPMCLEARKGDSKSTSFRIPARQRETCHKAGQMDEFEMPKMSPPKSCASVDQIAVKPPYFFYGNVMNLSQGSWMKISQFLYAMEPEFVNSQFFSALNRKEGYIHNLPTENRFHILPKQPMTIEEAIPYTKKWWPLWDTRKQLTCISSETNGISQLCDRIGKMLTDSKGILSFEQQRDLIHQCKTLNLVWVGHHKLAPIEPEYLERILGYPVHHTQAAEFSLNERLQSLKHCFQTDTLGYHLSVLKYLFPGGLSVLSIYSGVGGAEITLQRLDIHLKGVVSVEPCEKKQRILKKWWENTGQTGELVQVEDIQKLSSTKLESLIKKFGGFDLIICQNPYSYSSKNPRMIADSDDLGSLDFSLFYEFVRVLQRVRGTMERSR